MAIQENGVQISSQSGKNVSSAELFSFPQYQELGSVY